ncbi:MAG TPA: hypothetical protein VEF76_13720 [Patescibacteria group bacterium]|nr:hypothetical protein [Patescibacteria group bacterium]
MKLIAAALAFLALTLPAGAYAYDTPLTDPGAKKLLEKHAETAQKYADQFGCSNFVWGNIQNKSGGQIVTLQYMPPELEDPNKWTRMLSVTIYALSGDKKADKDAQKNLIELLRTQFMRPGNLVSADENYLINNNEDPALFIQYTTGRGTPAEVTYAGSFLRHTENSAAFIQLSARSRPLKKSESVNMHLLVNPQAANWPPEKKGRK